MKVSLLIVEDDKLMNRSLRVFFSQKGYRVFTAATGQEGMALYQQNKFDLVLLDLRLPDGNGLGLLGQMKEADDDPNIVIITAYPDLKTAVSAIKAGAFDYITKPFELDELDLLVEKALESRRLRSEVLSLRHQARKSARTSEILGNSPAIQRVKELIAQVAQTPHTPVLIQGESGTGKELVADAIHYGSERAERPLVKVNCSAIPESLMESELFGHEKGAFTGAQQARPGLFEMANGGSLFLDEIGELGLGLQPKLLRIIEGQAFRRLGGQREVEVDVRIIAATHQNLPTLVSRGSFREDLYYRLKVIVIQVPPLRERGEDILLLAERFLQEMREDLRKRVGGFSAEACRLLLRYPWPGNVRELKNVLERAVILARSEVVRPEDLPSELRDLPGSKGPEGCSPLMETDLSLEAVERAHIRRVLDRLDWNKSRAARVLGIGRSTLDEKIKRFGWKGSDG